MNKNVHLAFNHAEYDSLLVYFTPMWPPSFGSLLFATFWNLVSLPYGILKCLLDTHLIFLAMELPNKAIWRKQEFWR